MVWITCYDDDDDFYIPEEERGCHACEYGKMCCNPRWVYSCPGCGSF